MKKRTDDRRKTGKRPEKQIDWKDPGLRKVLITFFIFKICIIGLMLLSINIFPIFQEGRDENFRYPQDEPFSMWSAFKVWDSHHYVYLAEVGYGPDRLSNMFYPLYPLLIRAANLVFQNSVLSGMILSHIFALVATIYMYLFVKERFSSKVAVASCMLFIAFPTSFFLGMVYTEALFIMLIMIFFFHLYRGDFWPASIAAFLIPLTRPPGFLIVAPLFFFLLYRHYKEKKFRFMKEHLHFLGFTAGLGTYLAMMKYYTGSWFTGFTSQVYSIADNSIINYFFVYEWFMRNFVTLDWTIHTFVWSAIDRVFFVLFLIVLYLIYKKLDTTHLVFALALGLGTALAGNFLAYTRYLLIIFPIYIALALTLKKDYHYLMYPMIMMQSLFIVMHSLNYWVA